MQQDLSSFRIHSHISDFCDKMKFPFTIIFSVNSLEQLSCHLLHTFIYICIIYFQNLHSLPYIQICIHCNIQNFHSTYKKDVWKRILSNVKFVTYLFVFCLQNRMVAVVFDDNYIGNCFSTCCLYCVNYLDKDILNILNDSCLSFEPQFW